MSVKNNPNSETDAMSGLANGKEAWETPAIESFAPVKSAQGISYTPGDGISNLSP